MTIWGRNGVSHEQREIETEERKVAMKGRLIRMLALASLLGGVGAVAAIAAENEEPGIAVGQKAPEFTLADQTGKKQSLGSFLEQQKKVALVFYRSADW